MTPSAPTPPRGLALDQAAYDAGQDARIRAVRREAHASLAAAVIERIITA